MHFMCICTIKVVTRLKNKRTYNQTAVSTNNHRNESLSVETRKTSSQSWPCELDKGHSLLEINCSLWIYKGVSNQLL